MGLISLGEKEVTVHPLHFINMRNTVEKLFVNSLQQGKLGKMSCTLGFLSPTIGFFFPQEATTDFSRLVCRKILKTRIYPQSNGISKYVNQTSLQLLFSLNIFSSPGKCPYFPPHSLKRKSSEN